MTYRIPLFKVIQGHRNRHGSIPVTQWRRKGSCRPGQRPMVPPLQPATPILSALN